MSTVRNSEVSLIRRLLNCMFYVCSFQSGSLLSAAVSDELGEESDSSLDGSDEEHEQTL